MIGYFKFFVSFKQKQKKKKTVRCPLLFISVDRRTYIYIYIIHFL